MLIAIIPLQAFVIFAKYYFINIWWGLGRKCDLILVFDLRLWCLTVPCRVALEDVDPPCLRASSFSSLGGLAWFTEAAVGLLLQMFVLVASAILGVC